MGRSLDMIDRMETARTAVTSCCPLIKRIYEGQRKVLTVHAVFFLSRFTLSDSGISSSVPAAKVMGDPFPIYKETLSPMKVTIYTAKLTFASSSISEISKFACAVVRSLGIVANGISATPVFSCRTLVEI